MTLTEETVKDLCKLHERFLGDLSKEGYFHTYDVTDISAWAELVLTAATKLGRAERQRDEAVETLRKIRDYTGAFPASSINGIAREALQSLGVKP